VKPIPGVTDMYAEQQEMHRPDRDQPIREQMRAPDDFEGHGSDELNCGGGESISSINIGQLTYPVIVQLAEKTGAAWKIFETYCAEQQRRAGDALISPTCGFESRQYDQPRGCITAMVVQHNVSGGHWEK